MNVVVRAADVQDRDGAPLVLDPRTHRLVPFAARVFADAGYQGLKAAAAVAKTGAWTLEIVKRTLAWISRNRHLARDFERCARTFAAFMRLAMIRVMLRRSTRLSLCS